MINFSCVAVETSSKESVEKQYVIHTGPDDQSYFVRLLEHALSYSNGKYATKAIGSWLPHGREFKMLQEDTQINVAWGGAKPDRESLYLPIRFPVFRGLMGWRISLLKSKNKNIFSSITNLEKLRELSPGQHLNWSDTRILESNNIKVVTGSSYEGIFSMLDKGRFDHFPRAVIEIQRDLENHKQFDFVIDNKVLIYYPTASYFYVNKDNHELAEAISAGLEKALSDGSFDKMFYAEFGHILSALNIKSRTVVKLKNPLLSKETPLNRAELWLDPENF
jgi:hypothetical protein